MVVSLSRMSRVLVTSRARRHAVQIGEERREHGVLAIGLADVLIVGQDGSDRSAPLRPGRSVEREQLPGVADPAEVREAGEDSERRGKRQSELLEADCNFAGQNRSRRRSENSDAVRLVSLEKFFVDRDHIVDRGREGILRREAVVDRNDL